MRHLDDPEQSKYIELALGKKPKEELYILATDSEEMVNVAYEEDYAEIKSSLKAKLLAYLEAHEDPRVTEDPARFELPPFVEDYTGKHLGRRQVSVKQKK